MRSRNLGLGFALGAIALVSAPAGAASPAIYKCFDSHLSLVYTDVPCKDGEKLDIRAGDADPKAVARLDRALDQLDRSVAQRVQDERRASLARSYAGRLAPGPAADSEAETPDDSGYYTYPFLWPSMHRRPHKPHSSPRFESRHYVPMF